MSDTPAAATVARRKAPEGMTPLYRAAWCFFRIGFKVYFRGRAFNADQVPATGPVILAANHTSFIDPPLIGAGLSRQVCMLARKSLFRFPVYGSLLRRVHAIPVDPQGGSAGGLKTLSDRLREGRAVLIFPEGTRSRDGKLLPGRAGVGILTAKSAAPVVPVRIWATHEAYGRDKWFPRPGRVTIKYGRPLRFERLRAEATRCSRERLKAIYQEIADTVMKAIRNAQPFEDTATFP